MLRSLVDQLLTNRIQVLSIIGSLLLFLFILRLVKRKRLKEDYSLLWVGFGTVFILLSVFRPLLELVAAAIGIVYAPAALLLILVISVFFILIQFSIVISKLSEGNKNLIQEVAILKSEIKKINKSFKDQNNNDRKYD